MGIYQLSDKFPKVNISGILYIYNLHYEKFQDGSVKCIEDEIPFEVPEGWAWCRGYSCFSGMNNKKPSGEFFDYIDIETIDNRAHEICNPKHISVSNAPSRANRAINNGSVLFSFVRPYLENIAFVEEKNCHCIASTGFYVCNSNGSLIPQYMFLMMLSRYVIDGLNQFMKGDNSPSISKDNIENWLYPIPPITEQERIAKCIENLQIYANNISQCAYSLKNTIEDTKSKILNLAIRGKLVPQDLTDEPASTLLERIRAEKEELIKQGKIKRDKNASVIFKGDDNSYYEKMGNKVTCINEEIPFELPKNWMFVRLKNIWQLLSGRDLAPSDYNSIGDGIPYITGAGNFLNGTVSISRWTASPQVISETGDLLLTCKGTVGEMAFNDFGNAHIARQIMAIRNIYNLDSEYMFLCIKYYFDTLVISAKGLIPGISREDILNLILPIPPQQYQNRLVLQMKEIDKAVASAQGYIS